MKISYQIKLLIIHDRFYIRLSYCGNFLAFRVFITLLPVHMYTYLSIYSITLKILFRPIQVRYKHFWWLFQLTQNPFLATKTSKDILKDLFNSLITILLDQRLSLLHDGPQVVRSVNVMIVKIMEKSDYTNSLCALIKSLQECVSSEACSPKFLELIMKVGI